jgi:hypothetical protein
MFSVNIKHHYSCGFESIVNIRFYILFILPLNIGVVVQLVEAGKVAGSIPNEVILFFNWPNPFSLTVAMGST